MNNVEVSFLSALDKWNLRETPSSVCVCFSGGVDSSVLLYLFQKFRVNFPMKISACHMNHGIRGEEADRDEEFCRSVCQQYGVNFYSKRVDIPRLQAGSGCSLEETARNARYAWFSELKETLGFDFFATAHQKDDQAETVLYHIIRGTTTDGLCGIPERRSYFLRPLLNCYKSELEEYATAHGILFQKDSTNDDTTYARNCIRHVILPALEQLNPSVKDAITRLSGYVRSDTQYLNQLVAESRDIPGNLPEPLLRRKIINTYEEQFQRRICSGQLQKIISALQQKRQCSFDLADGIQAVCSSGTVRFTRKQEQAPCLKDTVLTEGYTELNHGSVRIWFSPEKIQKADCPKNVYNLSTEIPLLASGICGKIQYRSRKPGDRIRIFHVHKSLKKLFAEKQIPVFVRDSVPVFYDDQGIIFVPFVGIADRVFTKSAENSIWIRVEIQSDPDFKVGE